MLTDPPSDTLDLLVVGGLTIDRFADGSSAPGGSAMHIARAAATRGMRLGVITAAGPEPTARSGVDELNRLAAFVDVANATATTTFRHSQTVAVRELHLDRRGADLQTGAGTPGSPEARAILFAPVAGEIQAGAVGRWGTDLRRAAILQGWLRTVDSDTPVRPLPLVALDASLVEGLARFDLLVASREDLLAEGDDPAMQLLAVRQAVGAHPALVVTDALNGLWLSTGATAIHLDVPWQVDGVPTIGAGDILAAFMLAVLADQQPAAAAEQAMRIVADVLEERKRG